MIRYPKWLLKLPRDERTKAKAIYTFMFLHKNPRRFSGLTPQFATLIESAHWPDDGTFPSVSFMTANKLGVNDLQWDAWRNFSKLRGFLRKIKKQLHFGN